METASLYDIIWSLIGLFYEHMDGDGTRIFSVAVGKLLNLQTARYQVTR